MDVVTDRARHAYAEQVAEAMEKSARAMLAVALAFRDRPDEILAKVFPPNIFGMGPEEVAIFEITCLKDSALGIPRVVVKGRSIVVDQQSREIGFRLKCQGDDITPTRDNSVG